MKKHFIVKEEFRHLKENYSNPYLSKKELKTFINQNFLDRIKEVPFKYKIGDYVTCVKPLENFDIEDWESGSVTNPEGRGCYEEGRTFRVGNVQDGLAIFPDNRSFIRGGGVYANWIRPATEEEIREYKRALDEYEKELFDSLFSAC